MVSGKIKLLETFFTKNRFLLNVNNYTKESLLLALLCIAIGIIGGIVYDHWSLLCLNMLGVALASIALGPWWGAIIALLAYIILSFFLRENMDYLFYAVLSVYSAIYWGFICNLNLLKPLEGITSILNLTNIKAVKEFILFIIFSGGIFFLFLFNPLLNLLVKDMNSFLFYRSVIILDTLFCVVLSTLILFTFFPKLSNKLSSSQRQITDNITFTSIILFLILYSWAFIYCIRYYNSYWLFWCLPYVIAFISFFFTSKSNVFEEKKKYELVNVIYNGFFWFLTLSFLTSIMFYIFATQELLPKNLTNRNYFDSNGSIIILKDSITIFLIIFLVGFIFLILTQAVKYRESQELIRWIEVSKNDIANDIHNDPLQLISILSKKLPTAEKEMQKIKSILDETKNQGNLTLDISELEEKIISIDKIFSKYFSFYIPEIDISIRKIIKPLSNKEPESVLVEGLFPKLSTLIEDFKERNPSLTVQVEFKIKETDLNSVKSNNIWKKELYKILRELLNNIEKHSNAEIIELSVDIKKNKWNKILIITLKDNGSGFKPNKLNLNKDSFGLYEIQTRTKEIGAQIYYDFWYPENQDKKGTTVSFVLPFE
ncbi:MAG: ATP-binding protein [Cyanobacteriota bacterium]